MSANIKQIDFLPAKYREVEAQRHSQWWRVLVLVLFGGAVCATKVGQIFQHRQMQAQLDDATVHFNAAQTESQRLLRAQQAIAGERTTAELLTYLRHSWPRSQLLASISEPLPDEVTIDRIRLLREVIRIDPALAPAPANGAAVADTRLPVERDLARLRDETDQSRVVIILDGATRDDASLHAYLARLARDPLLAENELLSLERDNAQLRFSVRVEVRPGYGQRRGPTGPRQTAPQQQAKLSVDKNVSTSSVQQ